MPNKRNALKTASGTKNKKKSAGNKDFDNLRLDNGNKDELRSFPVSPVEINNSRFLPRLHPTNGTAEAVKWLALLFMTLDHANEFLWYSAYPILFNLGRIAAPLFGFVLAHNLARPQTLETGVYKRVIFRLAIAGAIASIPFVAMTGKELLWGWWPLNIMLTLAVSTGCIYLIDRKQKFSIVLATLLFLVGGSSVEFWYPAIGLCIAAWFYCKRPSWLALGFWIITTAALVTSNRNYWALAAFPIIFVTPVIQLKVPRVKLFYYVYYPLHLALFATLSLLHVASLGMK